MQFNNYCNKFVTVLNNNNIYRLNQQAELSKVKL